MTTQQKTSPSKLQNVLKAFFASRQIEVTKESLVMWLDGLGDLTPDQIEYAVRRFNRESSEYPTPERVRRFAMPTDEERAEVAWATVVKTVRQYGAYYRANFDDPVCNAAIRQIGGWVEICNSSSDQLTWKRKEFVKAYTSIGRHGQGDGSPLPGLPGFNAEPVDIPVGLPMHPSARRLTTSAKSQQFAIPALKGIE